MKQPSLKERLYRYLLQKHGFVASGDLQRIVMENTSYTPRTTVRRLQEMFESGELERDIRKGHAFYRAVPKMDYTQHAKEVCELFDKGVYLQV